MIARWPALALILLAEPAAARYHCPHGQIYRIHLGQCVDHKSPLARAYAYAYAPPPRPRRIELAIPAPPVRAPTPEIPPIIIPPLTPPAPPPAARDDDAARGLAIDKLRQMLVK